MATYAANTSVPPSRSRDEIQKTCERYGATAFGFAMHAERVMVEFIMRGYRVRMIVELPKIDDDEVRLTERGRRRPNAQAVQAHAQLVRQRWRALALFIKAKLEAVETGVVTFEQEWLPYLVLPETNRTVGEAIAPNVGRALKGDEPQWLLPAYDPPSLPSPKEPR